MRKYDCTSHVTRILSYKFLSINVWLKFLLLGYFLMNLPGVLSAQTTESQVTFEKVQEKTYDDSISGIAFGSFVKGGTEQIYCKLIALKNKEVQFLDKSGNVIARESLIANKSGEFARYSGKEVILSNKGNFVAIHDYTKQKGNTDYIVEDEYKICDDKGKEIYKIKGPMYGTGQQDRMLISDMGGSAVGTRYEYGGIDFYNPSGQVKTVSLFGDLDWGSRMGWAGFSGNCEYLVIVTQEMPGPNHDIYREKEGVWIIMYDHTGKELWRTKMDKTEFHGEMTSSETGDFLILRIGIWEAGSDVGGHATVLYDRKGNMLTSIDTFYTSSSSICFSPKEDYVAVVKNNSLTLMKTVDDSIIFQRECRLGNVDLFSDDGKYLIAKGEVKIGSKPDIIRGVEVMRPFYTDRVYIFDMTGEQVWQNDFSDLQRIFSENGYLVFIMPYKYEIYKENKDMEKR
jgi:hypothetical protein